MPNANGTSYFRLPAARFLAGEDIYVEGGLDGVANTVRAWVETTNPVDHLIPMRLAVQEFDGVSHVIDRYADEVAGTPDRYMVSSCQCVPVNGRVRVKLSAASNPFTVTAADAAAHVCLAITPGVAQEFEHTSMHQIIVGGAEVAVADKYIVRAPRGTSSVWARWFNVGTGAWSALTPGVIAPGYVAMPADADGWYATFGAEFYVCSDANVVSMAAVGGAVPIMVRARGKW